MKDNIGGVCKTVFHSEVLIDIDREIDKWRSGKRWNKKNVGGWGY